MSYRSGPRDHEQPERSDEQQLLHDLQVHQLELEMQNEELRRVQHELDAARLRYFELYDLAPVGYCTVNDGGSITESNLAAAALLGVDRSALKRRLFSRFIMPEDAGLFHLLRRDLSAHGAAQSRELRLRRADGSARRVRVHASEATGEGGASQLRLVLSDVTDPDATGVVGP
jgi:PAS domain S-box-containing protein